MQCTDVLGFRRYLTTICEKLVVFLALWTVNSPVISVHTLSIAQFAITINSNVCPHIWVLNTLMRESYA